MLIASPTDNRIIPVTTRLEVSYCYLKILESVLVPWGRCHQFIAPNQFHAGVRHFHLFFLLHFLILVLVLVLVLQNCKKRANILTIRPPHRERLPIRLWVENFRLARLHREL